MLRYRSRDEVIGVQGRFADELGFYQNRSFEPTESGIGIGLEGRRLSCTIQTDDRAREFGLRRRLRRNSVAQEVEAVDPRQHLARLASQATLGPPEWTSRSPKDLFADGPRAADCPVAFVTRISQYVQDISPGHGLFMHDREQAPAIRSCGSSKSRLKELIEMLRRQAILSTLWIFALATYMYGDIAGLMDSVLLKQYLSGTVNGLRMTEGFLLGGVMLMMIPISMILLSRVLRYRANRIANIVAGTVMTGVQATTLFVGSGPTVYYAFSSAVVIAATAFIVWYAVTWRSPEPAALAEGADPARGACGAVGQPACASGAAV